MIDFSRLDPKDVPNGVDLHRPIPFACDRKRIWADESQMPLVMNHCANSLEQFLFRESDRRGGPEHLHKRCLREKNCKRHHDVNPPILEWLPGFVETVGEAEAFRLLQHAGNPLGANAGTYRDPSQEPTKEEAVLRIQALIQNLTSTAQELNEKAEEPKPAKEEAQQPLLKVTLKRKEGTQLELVHIAKTGGTAIEVAAARQNVTWGVCHYRDMPKNSLPMNSSKSEFPGCFHRAKRLPVGTITI